MLTASASFDFSIAPAAGRWVMYGGWQPNLAVIIGGRGLSEAMHRRSRFGFARRRAQTDFERLVRPHLHHLYKLAYRFTGSAESAEDLIQELLVRLYTRRNELEKVQLLRPWLARVLYRLFIDQTRRDARSPYVSIADTDFADDGDSGDPYAAVADATPGPDAEFALNVDRERLMHAWQELSAEHRAVLALYEVEGYTLDELETLLDITRGTLKSRLHRARMRLAQLLAREPFDAFERVNSKGKT
jgi:RNA polymerase sigma factor (sigma-70 family)